MIAISRNLGFAGLALLGWAGMAHAAPVVADFAGSPATPAELTIDLGGGLSVTAAAFTHGDSLNAGADAPFPTVTGALLFRGIEGLGVQSPADNNSVNLDANGLSEFIRFTFNQSVTLLEAVFDNVSPSGENFDMAVDGVDVDVAALLGTDSVSDLPDAAFGIDSNLAGFFGDGLTGTVFEFYTADADDSYQIRQFLVEAVADGGAADVPAPGALMLLGFGLAGLGFARRRRG